MTIPADRDVDVQIDLSPKSLPRKDFNLGLILGTTSVIDTTDRVKFYADLTEMIDDGFDIADAVYKGAETYFKEEGNLGASIAGVYVATIGSGETPSEAILDARSKDSSWYGFSTVDAMTVTAIGLLADTVETMLQTFYFGTSTDVTLKAGTDGNLLDQLKLKGYKQCLITFHEDADFSCGVLGYAMGATTGLRNSAFTLKFKQIIGKLPSNLTSGQANAIEKFNGNCYIEVITPQFEQGTTPSGAYADEILNLAKLANDIQLGVYDALKTTPKVSQTDVGQNELALKIGQACDQAVKIGFIAKNGKWRKPAVLEIQTGDILPEGYVILWESVDLQSDADRDAREAQPFYVCVTLAGAIHSAIIKVNVSR